MSFLRDKGYKVIVIAPDDNYTERVRKDGFEVFDIKINRSGTNPIQDIGMVINYFKLYRMISPDLICNFTIKPNIYGSIAARFLKIPTINNISGLGTLFIEKSFKTTIAKLLYKVSLKFTEKVFFQNPDDCNLFLKEHLVSQAKTAIVPGSGINVTKYSSSLIAPAKINDFIFISRLLKDKGIYEYIDAARIVKKEKPDVTFAVMGPLDFDNKTSIRENDLKKWKSEGIVQVLEASDDVRNAIAISSCIVLPSYREGIPRILLEAGSMGKMLITTDVAGCKEVVINNYNGFLCDPESPDSLSKSMFKMISLSESERFQMGENSRKIIESKFDEKFVFQIYQSAIESLI